MLKRVDVTFYDTFTYAPEPPAVKITKENFYGGFALEHPITYDNFIDESIYIPKAYFKRAERQRDVLTAMLEKAKTVSFSALSDAAKAIMPNVSTSLSVEDFIKMMSVASDYEVTVSDGFPFEGMRNGGTIGQKGSCVVPTDLTRNVRHLHELLFDDDSYEPSGSVKKFSQKIQADTEGFLQY